MNILVIDVGTSSMRGILLTHEGKELVKKQCFYKPFYGKNGWVEQKASDWERALFIITKVIAEQAKAHSWEIDAISVTAQRSSVIPVDASIKPLCKAIMWQDRRANEICEELKWANDRIFDLCGSRVNPVFSGGKIAWLKKKQPELYGKTWKFLVIPDYLQYLMTGKLCTDHTYGSRSLLMNLRRRQWDAELLNLFNIEKEKLCELVTPGIICGMTTKEFAGRTGCKEGIPVLTAGGDQQCGAVGQGVINEGDVSITAGTGAFLLASVRRVPENLKSDVICNASAIKNQYVLESNVLTCCSAFDWFRHEFFGMDSYEKINRELATVPPGSNGCLCIPYFQGRTTPDWNKEAKGVFANVTLATTKQDMLRSILEGLSYEVANGIENMKKYIDISSIYVNGGLTESELFNEIQCNVYKNRIIRRGKADATARGALMIGAVTLGMYRTVSDAFAAISSGDSVKEYYPSDKMEEVYQIYRKEMNQLYRKMWIV